jgi:hypothetical protein
MMWVLAFALLAAVHAQPISDLIKDIPTNAQVALGAENYYQLAIDAVDRGKYLTLIVTPLGDGDPDLFADFVSQYPDSSAEFVSFMAGEDALTIPPTRLATESRIYIGISGFQPTNYTLVATFEGIINLVDGRPQSNTVPLEGSDYYTFLPPASSDVSVVATILQGEIALFVGAGFQPTPWNYTWGNPFYGGELLLIPATDGRFPPVGTPLYVTVFGRRDAVYSISASASANRILRDGIPQQGSVTYTTPQYYEIYVSAPGCSLSLTVTPFSGDPDLYASQTVAHPNSTSHDRASLAAVGIDQIVYDPASVGSYFLAVVTVSSNSSYSITADQDCSGNHTRDFVYLIDGIPQQGALDTGAVKYYMIRLQGHHTSLTVSISRRTGDPDLYIRNDQYRPGPDNYQWRSANYGDDSVTINRTDVNWCNNCTYYIGVVAATNTTYSLVASTSDAIIVLQAGTPLQDRLNAGEYEYYVFQVDSINATDITIVVTPVGFGDADIYLSTTVRQPNATNYTWVSARTAGDALTIPNTDPKFCTNCRYYIGVNGYTDVTYTIVATFNQAVRLTDGGLQGGTVERGEMELYEFRVLTGHRDLTLTLSCSSGSATLYAGTSQFPEWNDPSTYYWRAYGFSAVKSLIVLESDEHACQNATCKYYIGVYGVTNSTYTLLATTANSTTPLRSGVGIEAWVDQGGWEYFSFAVIEPGMTLDVTVTALTGDPDLYISTITPRPTLDDYEYRSLNVGDDHIFIATPNLTTYYIGVYAFRNSTFRVTAVLGSDAIITLHNGEPQTGLLNVSLYKYYSLNLQNTVLEDVTFSLTPIFGDPDLFITNDGTYPSITNYRWSSRLNATDSIRILSPRPVFYNVAVYANTPTQYTIIASTSSTITQLQDGVLVHGSGLSGETVYYRLWVNDPSADVTLTVTSFSGDPDLYVSTTVSQPNSTEYDWKATSYQSDSITVPHTDEKFCSNCWFFIGVYCFSSTTFTIQASFAQSVALQDGVPQSGVVDKEAFRYYRFRVLNGHSDLTISVVPTSGNPDLYVQLGSLPEIDNYTWYVHQSGGENIVISRTDPNFCALPECTYFIGVHGRGRNASYSLVVTTSAQRLLLQPGIPVREWVAQREFEYFTFIVPDQPVGQDLTITLTALTGDPDLFVSRTCVYPNQTCNDWSSIAVGGDAVGIPNAAPGSYFISVYAFYNSTFSISAFLESNSSNSTALLLNGVPQSGVVNNGAWKYFRYELSQSPSSVSFMLTRQAGNPDLYISNDGLLPNDTHWTWQSVLWGIDQIDIAQPTPGTYYVGVRGSSTSYFTLTGVSSDSSSALLDGVPTRDALNMTEYRYYTFLVDRTDRDLTVTVTAITGDPDMYISNITEHPNSTNFTWSATSFREDSITIPSDELQIATYYISVYAFSSTSFSIVASLQPRVRLENGVPMSGTVPKEGMKYYTWTVLESGDYTFTLTPFNGSVYLYISTTEEPEYSRPESYQWSATNWFTSQQIVLRAGQQPVCFNCTYYIGVYGAFGDAPSFSILATSSSATNTLLDGVTQRAWLDTGSWTYYSFFLTNPNAVLTFVVTPLSGDPDLYVSTINSRPSQDNATWISRMLGADAVEIDPSDPNFVLGTYFVGVFAYSNSTFTIIANVFDQANNNNTNIDYLLLNGQPQVGLITVSQAMRYYMFTMPHTNANLEITVTPTYGDPDLYVIQGTTRANMSYYNWSADHWGADTLVIPNACGGCQFMITVLCSDAHTLYSLVARTANSITTLLLGVPLTDHVGSGDYKYYAVDVGRRDQPLIITATIISGPSDNPDLYPDPDLYISFNQSNQYPNNTNYDWRSISMGDDLWTLPNPERGRYYVSVLGFRNTTYSITVTNGPLTLLPNQPQRGNVQAGEIRNYTFYFNSAGDLEFLLTNDDNGMAEMYISANTSASQINYQWSTIIVSPGSARGQVRISQFDANRCTDCVYYVAVIGTTRAAYTITAISGGIPTTLVTGRPITTDVAMGVYRNYRAIIDQNTDINLDVTMFVGSINVYASFTNQQPNMDNYTWTATYVPGYSGLHLTIPKTDANFTLGPLYLSLYGLEDSRVSLTLSTHGSMLTPGTPQLSQIPTTGTAASYFFMRYDSRGGSRASAIYFSLDQYNTRRTGPFILYVSNLTSEPNENDYIWKAEMALGGQPLVIQPTDRNFCASCTYYVAVNGVAGSRFALKATTDDTYDVLIEDVTVWSSLTANNYKYYELYVPEAANFSVWVETCTGDANLYVTVDSFHPSKDHYRWASEATDRIDVVKVHDNTLTTTSFYIGVLGVANSNYRITAHSRQLPEPPEPGDGGILRSAADVNSVFLSWDPATSQTADSLLKYTIYYSTERTDVVMYSFCGLAFATKAAEFSTVSTNRLSYTVKGLSTGETYRFNVVVEDTSGNKQVYRQIAGVKVLGPSSSSYPVGKVLAIAIPMALAVTCVVICLIVKNRKLTQELRIEMHDVPKSAFDKATRDPAQRVKGANFSRLLEEEGADEYAAPDTGGVN